jgi:hypothetical protein
MGRANFVWGGGHPILPECELAKGKKKITHWIILPSASQLKETEIKREKLGSKKGR